MSGRGGDLQRRVTGWVQPSPTIADPEQRRRAALVVSMAFALALVLSFSAVLSSITTTIAPDSPSTLGWRGTAVVALAAVGFWIAWWQSRTPRFLRGAWITIVVIYAFLTVLSLMYDTAAAAMMPALVVPVLAGTIFLPLKGVLQLVGVTLLVALLYLFPLSSHLIDFCYAFGILVAVLAVTVIVALMREQDLRELRRLRDLERAEADRLRAEATLARAVQLAMLPDRLPEAVGVELGAYSEPAREASGDFYDLFLVEHGTDPALGSLVVVVADVAGKGMASALVMSAARTALRTESERDPSPGAVLERLNRLLHASMPPHLFLTIFLGVLDLATGELRFASGGHPHPYHWSEAQRSLEELVSHGLPVGLVEEAEYEEQRCSLGRGDLVVGFTDGLVEALNADRELYGFERVRDDVRAAVAELDTVERRISYLVDAMEAFVAGAPAEDDVTLVALAVPMASEPTGAVEEAVIAGLPLMGAADGSA